MNKNLLIGFGIGSGSTALITIPLIIKEKGKNKNAYRSGVIDGLDGKISYLEMDQEIEELQKRLRRLERL